MYKESPVPYPGASGSSRLCPSLSQGYGEAKFLGKFFEEIQIIEALHKMNLSRVSENDFQAGTSQLRAFKPKILFSLHPAVHHTFLAQAFLSTWPA